MPVYTVIQLTALMPPVNVVITDDVKQFEKLQCCGTTIGGNIITALCEESSAEAVRSILNETSKISEE